MTTQNDDMTETVVNAGDTVKTDDIELEAPKNAMATARRLFVQLGNQRVRLCVVAALILAILYLGEWGFYYLQSYLMASVAENLNLTLRKQISAKIQRLPLRFFDRNKPGEVLSKVTNDLDRISEVMQTGLLRLITAITTVTGSLVIMVYYSWLLTVVFLVFMALSMWVTKLVARKNLEIASLRQETIGELTGLAEEYYKGRNIIKAYNREEDSAAAMEDAAERTRKAAQLADFITISVNPLIRMIARFSQMAVMLLAGWMVLGGRMTVGVAQAFYQYINQVSEPLTEASYMINSLQSALASAERTFELLDEEEERPDPQPADAAKIAEEPVQGRVVFNHVRFGYDPQRPLTSWPSQGRRSQSSGQPARARPR